jgi:hypothetical protein
MATLEEPERHFESPRFLPVEFEFLPAIHSSLTSSDLDQYHLRSERIADLYQELDTIARRRFNNVPPRLVLKHAG